jgi:hypothetical protein
MKREFKGCSQFAELADYQEPVDVTTKRQTNKKKK